MIDETLATARYVNLATFRRDGRRVETPVWVAADNDRMYVFSEADAGKVKRLRNGDRAEMAVCTFNGSLLSDWSSVQGRILDEVEADIALKALRRKYGVQMYIADFFSRLTGRFNKRAYLGFTQTT
jgi:PPOX class probable F420-dependent enzyme